MSAKKIKKVNNFFDTSFNDQYLLGAGVNQEKKTISKSKKVTGVQTPKEVLLSIV